MNTPKPRHPEDVTEIGFAGAGAGAIASALGTRGFPAPPLCGVAAAVDVEDGAVDEAGAVAGEVADGGGDLLGGGRAAGGMTASSPLTGQRRTAWSQPLSF